MAKRISEGFAMLCVGWKSKLGGCWEAVAVRGAGAAAPAAPGDEHPASRLWGTGAAVINKIYFGATLNHSIEEGHEKETQEKNLNSREIPF